MKKQLAIISVLFFCACNTSEKKEVAAKDPSEVVKQLDEKGNQITKWFKNTGALPFTADTSVFNNVKGFDSLGTAEIKILTLNKSKTNKTDEVDYDLADFYKIDSLKAAGVYLKWCDSLDIGMTKYANAYAINKTILNENTTLLFWVLATSSYEACPYATTIDVYLTVVYNNAVGPCFRLGGYGSYGDPPVSLERTFTGTLNKDGKIIQNLYEVHDEDMDQPFLFITKEYYESEIKDGKIISVKEEKEKPVKTKRPKQN